MSICTNELSVRGDFNNVDDVKYFFENEIRGSTVSLTDVCINFFGENILIEPLDRNMYYGTSWIDVISIEYDEDDEKLFIIFDSSWLPPLKLIDEISSYFEVFCTLEYSEPIANVGGIYSSSFGTKGPHQKLNYYRFWYEHKKDSSVLDNLLEYCSDAEELELIIERFDFKVKKKDKEKLLQKFNQQ